MFDDKDNIKLLAALVFLFFLAVSLFFLAYDALIYE
tara:strand:+ start:163 stop:270 length:108 start_codon:yes stop_codon:yes gene_type:complete